MLFTFTALTWFTSVRTFVLSCCPLTLTEAVCDNSESKDPQLCLKRICSVTCVTRLSVQIASAVYSREVPVITLTSKPQELVISGQRGEITLQTANWLLPMQTGAYIIDSYMFKTHCYITKSVKVKSYKAVHNYKFHKYSQRVWGLKHLSLIDYIHKTRKIDPFIEKGDLCYFSC